MVMGFQKGYINMIDYDFCVSSYLVFRYIVKENIAWKKGVMPTFPAVVKREKVKVRTSADVLEKLQEIIGHIKNPEKLGILLSGGIDSAIIAALFPRGTKAYTIRFVAEGAIDETSEARKVAEQLGLKHSVVDLTWDDYNKEMDKLMRWKKAPLHPVEVGLYKASLKAHNDGIGFLAVGNVADSTFGGFDKLLSRDWSFDEFIERYTFIDPRSAVKRPVSMRNIFEPYRQGNGINIIKFLKEVHGPGISQMFDNAIRAGGCEQLAPFEDLLLDAPLDLQRIRNGEPKYILVEIYKKLFGNMEAPEKIPFARPMAQWLGNWEGPSREEFLDNIPLNKLSGEQKWQLYSLQRFLNIIEESR